MKRRAHTSEQQVAEVVVSYLEAMGADVYQEVTIAGGVADVVARVRAEVWIVEVKTSLSLALVTQAMGRRRLAHRVIIAAPFTRHGGSVGGICAEVGLGLWEVRASDLDWPSSQPRVREIVDARRWNRHPVELAGKLKPEHKTHAKAGAIGGGGRWTPFRATCEEILRVVKLEPGITVKAAIEQIKHHYSSNRSATSSIAHWVERGKVDGVRLERDPLRLFPAEVKAA